MGFSKDEINGLYAVVASILSLGNVNFRETKPDQSEVDPCSKAFLETAGANFGVDPAVLGSVLVTKEIRVRGQEKTAACLNTDKASQTRHALAKYVYGRMFDWLVIRVNKSMGNEMGLRSSSLRIGLLDIFGFEIFEHNSFEQLCINFTNEMLQQHFNNNTFKLEEKLYFDEGIDFAHISFIDNTPMIELITARRVGILPSLDEELIVPGGSDKGFLDKLKDEHTGNTVFSGDGHGSGSLCFVIKHYAGKVTYDSSGFLEKNRDTLTEDLIEMLQTSNNNFVSSLYPKTEEVSKAERKSSLSKQFQSQLTTLMKQLYLTEPHYIRCIKPNEVRRLPEQLM